MARLIYTHVFFKPKSTCNPVVAQFCHFTDWNYDGVTVLLPTGRNKVAFQLMNFWFRCDENKYIFVRFEDFPRIAEKT